MILLIIVSLLKYCLQYKNLGNWTENICTENNLKNFSGTKLHERLKDITLTTKAGLFFYFIKNIYFDEKY